MTQRHDTSMSARATRILLYRAQRFSSTCIGVDRFASSQPARPREPAARRGNPLNAQMLARPRSKSSGVVGCGHAVGCDARSQRGYAPCGQETIWSIACLPDRGSASSSMAATAAANHETNRSRCVDGTSHAQRSAIEHVRVDHRRADISMAQSDAARNRCP